MYPVLADTSGIAFALPSDRCPKPVGGGISGAIVVTAGTDAAAPEPIAPATTAVEPTTTTSAPGTATTASPAPAPAPSTTAYEPPPVTVTPAQPVQDFTAYCTVPNLVGTWLRPQLVQGNFFHVVVNEMLRDADCGGQLPAGYDNTLCVDPTVPADSVRILAQDPAPGTLVHKLLGSVSYTMRIPPRPVGSTYPSC